MFRLLFPGGRRILHHYWNSTRTQVPPNSFITSIKWTTRPCGTFPCTSPPSLQCPLIGSEYLRNWLLFDCPYCTLFFCLTALHVWVVCWVLLLRQWLYEFSLYEERIIVNWWYLFSGGLAFAFAGNGKDGVEWVRLVTDGQMVVDDIPGFCFSQQARGKEGSCGYPAVMWLGACW